jgi:hypothetical protein
LSLVDFDALVLGPSYAILGTTATYTPVGGPAVSITVIDQTKGEEIMTDAAAGISATVPTVHARESDIADPAEGGTILVNGTTWIIESSIPAPGPGGTSSGERILILAEQ